MNKFFIGLLLLFIIAGGIYFFTQSPQTTSPTNSTTSQPQVTTTGDKYALDQVASHNQPSDCWIAIEGKIYDVTKYIDENRHPGGEEILEGCGKNATNMFNNRPEDGRPHSDTAWSLLSDFYIGDLQ
ncbi:cytochrome b5 domain-containing protein [Candidatus Woesebacteria bacterium]|nr:cytochrome b5 domain-containing protein [Candidatus Woesebacteria bacterium]